LTKPLLTLGLRGFSFQISLLRGSLLRGLVNKFMQ